MLWAGHAEGDRARVCAGPRGEHVRTFGTTTAELLALRDWLQAHGVTQVAMESTGIY
jgi:transposase